ncbi:hypothetical protein ACEXQB_006855 [Herbiconiux sp. P18]|uniref:hypothetical protein n=1 Tax=Herbiconiux liangxiaofengii TaxID=3342795 RepID=UPI0035B95DD2
MTLFEPGGPEQPRPRHGQPTPDAAASAADEGAADRSRAPQYGERLAEGSSEHAAWERLVQENSPWVRDLAAQRRRRRGAVLSIVFFAMLLAGGVAFHLTGAFGSLGQRGAALDAPYQPSLAVSAIATGLQLTDAGQQIFYAARPEVLDATPFLAVCGDPDAPADGSEDPIGCYSSPPERIAIFHPEDARLDSQMTTTAAHELLHAVWARLTDDEQATLRPLLEAQYSRIPADDPVQEQITGSVGDDRFNRATELFAYLGSQNTGAGPLDPELEAFYARYFTARQTVADLDSTLQSTLTNGWAAYETHATELSALTQANAQERAQLDADTAQLAADREMLAGQVTDYEARPADEQSRLYRVGDDGEFAEPWGDYLAGLQVELDGRATSYADREAALTGSIAQEDQLEAALDTEYAGLVQLDEAGLPR